MSFGLVRRRLGGSPATPLTKALPEFSTGLYFEFLGRPWSVRLSHTCFLCCLPTHSGFVVQEVSCILSSVGFVGCSRAKQNKVSSARHFPLPVWTVLKAAQAQGSKFAACCLYCRCRPKCSFATWVICDQRVQSEDMSDLFSFA